MRWPQSEIILSERLRLEPLSVDHALGMVEILADPALYEYTGGEAPSFEELQRRYATQSAGHSPNKQQGWLNWIVTTREGEKPIGFVQATLEQNQRALSAEIAWVISPAHQGNGMASEATKAMISWLRLRDVDTFVAHVHPDHHASLGVARNAGLHPTRTVVAGEIRWES